jgi:hypothetical protein
MPPAEILSTMKVAVEKVTLLGFLVVAICTAEGSVGIIDARANDKMRHPIKRGGQGNATSSLKYSRWYGSPPYLRVAIQLLNDPVEAYFSSCSEVIPPMFNTETEIAASLKLTPYYWPDVATADFVLVVAQPLKYMYCAVYYSEYKLQHEDALAYSGRILQDRVVPWLARHVPRWNVSDGRDFMFVLGAGAGNKILRKVPALLSSVILSVSGDSSDDIWRKLPRVVTIPPYVEPFVPLSDTIFPMKHTDASIIRGVSMSSLAGGGVKVNRSVVQKDLEFAYTNRSKCMGHFRGIVTSPFEYYSRGTRQFLFDRYTKGLEPKLRIKEGYVTNEEFLVEVHGCRFGLGLPGYYTFTPRPVEYANAGVVPVIVGDGWHPPFEHTFDWRAVSVTILERTVLTPGALVQELEAVPKRTWVDMMVRLEATRHLLIWESASKPKVEAQSDGPTLNATSLSGPRPSVAQRRGGRAWRLLAQELELMLTREGGAMDGATGDG